jgi:phosphohistidine phosphatase
MPRILLIVRHGKSRWNEVGVVDHDRKLAKRGKRDARRIGRELAARGLAPDVILTSTAKRARGTARRLAKAWDLQNDIYEEPLLYGDSDGVATHLGVLATLGGEIDTAMLVGHLPMLEDLVTDLTGEYVALPTANVACVVLPIDDWHQLVTERPRGRLSFVLSPKDLTD